MNLRTLRLFLATLVAFAVLAPFTFAAPDSFEIKEAPPAILSVDPVVSPDISNAKLPGGIPVATIVSLLATVITAGVKVGFQKLGTKLKPGLVPLVAVAASFLLDWLGHLTFGTDSNGWLALGAGLAAVGLNQLKKQATPDPSA